MKTLLKRLKEIAKDIAERDSCATDEYRIAALRAMRRQITGCLDEYIQWLESREWKKAKGDIIEPR
jgi:hypothetical protein